ncbi:hypothetical protein P170DRAFT_439193 [Aspergillus steynii IBT 23096]|uniref:Sex determining protein n=1 Tax=Aspergillus steynii IBT 23096 TaxID=1392250 RepID=A0A2I2FXT6_9EURO|nr:uncharacterized protein P170DRAFT_439193 [Aspergillus steynii IBT 23096]PLB45432.1 hypothetical protein P170DRAFT_439193 [Aspergillus steynii IBT 23096]
MYTWSAPSNHAGNAAAPGPAGGTGPTGPPGPASGVGLGGGAGATTAGGAATGPGGPVPVPGGGNPRLEPPGSAAQSASSSSFQMPHLRWPPSMMSRSSAAATTTAPHTGHAHGHAGQHTTLPNLAANLRMGTPNSTAQHLPHQSPVHHSHAQIQIPTPGHHPHPHAHTNTHPHSHSHPHSHQHSHSQAQAQPYAPGRHADVSVVVDARQGQTPQHHQHRHQQQHPHQQQHQTQAESMESSDSEQSDGGHREGRGGSGGDGSGDPDFTPSPGENIPSRREGGRGRRDNGRGGGRREADGMSAANPVLIDNSVGDEIASGGGGGSGAGNDASRKHGKRLTTKEEVSLFDICNRHAEEFGQRSNLCNWWRTVTAEFTHEQGHPYSWHSVRRKVELVTKQRMKFLHDQREKGGTEADDMSNPRWRASVDAWIPTWQRWEDAEARRIEKRDSRRPRKRKDRSWEPSAGGWEAPNSSDGGWRAASSPVVDNNRAFVHNTNNQSTSTPSQVRLPPGFDNMFTTPTATWSPMTGAPAASPAQRAAAPSSSGAADNSMMSAMLETLGKLNKHLDTVNPEQQNASPLASSLAGPPNQPNATPRRASQQDADGEDSDPPTLSATAMGKLKDELRRELRQEIRSELEKDRAAFEDRLDSVQRTQEMILEMLRQEPA